MSDDARIEANRQLLLEAQKKGGLSKFGAYVKLSGPGWMQSAITLGGGSLSGSLYLGIVAGVSMIWVQPFAMILGVIMLSAISYVTLTTGERPFRLINEHINPVLGWSWLIASLLATMVWAMPQYSLCYGVLEQNLLPSLFHGDGVLAPGPEGGEDFGKWVVSLVILVICLPVTWSYGSGSVGVKIYEAILKAVIAMVVLCFFGVVVRMSMVGDGVDWGGVWSGLMPKWRNLYQPSDTLMPLLEAIVDPAARQYWTDAIVSQQRDIMLAAGAAAVGINMTFFLPYNLLTSGWNKDFRSFSIFDLFTGMFFPFVLATGCVVIAAATQFHAQLPDGCLESGATVQVPKPLEKGYQKILSTRQGAMETGKYEMPAEPSLAEANLAAVLIVRDTGDLAKSLEQLFADDQGQGGRFFSNIVFGLGVVGMTMSTISVMMLISGFIFCEIFNVSPKGWAFRLGCLAATSGALWPIIWEGEHAYLAVPAGVFGAVLLPVAYLTFFLLMNQKSILGDERPKGMKRILWNTGMLIAVVAAGGAGISAIYKKGGNGGLMFLAAYVVLVLIVQVMRKPKHDAPSQDAPNRDAQA
ncbi:MAG: divalent metal cation transporter [Planctomycetes bacterium]|nr:divalent metal cation transporter [Planctomycetota bacterium]